MSESKNRDELREATASMRAKVFAESNQYTVMPKTKLRTEEESENERIGALEYRTEQAYSQFGIVGSFALSVRNALKTSISALSPSRVFGSAAAKDEGPKHTGPTREL